MQYLEDRDQALIFDYLERFRPEIRPLAFAIPNGGKRDAREGARLKLQGVTAGVPDIFIACPISPYSGLLIELKRPIIKGKPKPNVTKSQYEMIDRLSIAGYCAKVCYGFGEAVDVIHDYFLIDNHY
jgi:hypothetical protein